MTWRILMDQKDLLLIKARGALEATRGVLEKILQDDDDVTLAADVIGETDGEEDMQTTETPEEKTPTQKAREYVFARASKLSYEITPQQAERFYDEMMWSQYPAVNHQRIFEFFRDSRYEYPDLPSNPRYYTTLQFSHSADTRIRFDAVCEIITLFDELHRIDPSNDVQALLKRVKQKRESNMFRRETPIEKLRRHAFEEISQWTGKPEKQIAKVYDAIDWNDPVRWNEPSQTGRFAVVYEFLFTDLPQDQFYRRDPKTDEERKQRLAYSAYVTAAKRRARDLVHPVIKTLENLRTEISRMNHQQSLKAARKAQLAAQIERTKAELERLNAA